MGIFSAGSASVNIVPDFSGAQRAIARWAEGRDVTVRVNPEIDHADMARTDAEIARPRTMHVHVEVEKKQLLEAADFLTGFSTVGKALKGLFSPKVLGLTDAGGAAVAMAGALSQAAGAAALIPAGLAAAAAPIAVIAVGVQGMGAAFKAIGSGDAAKAQAALKDLAPSARDFVVQMHALAPAFHDLRLDVQQQLFQGLGKDISTLAKTYLPVLHQGLGDIATDLNAMVTQFARTMTETRNVTQVQAIFTNLNTTFGTLSTAIKPFTDAFVTLARVGSTFLPGMADGLAKAADAFNKWVQGAAASGQLTNIISTALTRIRQLFNLLVDAGRMVGAIMKPAIEAGASLLTTVDNLFKSLTRMLNTPLAQSALHTFFSSLAVAAKDLVGPITDIVQALVTGFLPVAGKLAQALAPIAGTLLSQFADLLRQIAPIIYPGLVNAVKLWFSAMGPLIPIFGEIISSILPPLVKLLGELAPVLGNIAEQFGTFLANALKLLAPYWVQLGEAIIAVVKALQPLLPPIFNLITSLLPPLIRIFEAVVSVVVKVVQALAPLVKQIVEYLTPVLKVLAEIVAWAFEKVIGPTILFVVTKIIVPVIQTVIDIIKALWQDIQWAWNNVIKPVWDAIGSAASALWNVFLKPAFTAIRDAWNWMGTEIGRIYHNFIEPIWKFFQDAIETVRKGFDTAVQGIQTIWHGLIHALEYPIQIAIDWVWNKTLMKAWNLLNNLWGGTDLKPIELPGFSAAEGAVLPGYTPGADVHRFVSPTAGVLNLSGGEAIMVPEFTKAVGEAQIYAWNKLARTNGPSAVRRQVMGYADGGVFPADNSFDSHRGLGDRSMGWAGGLAQAVIPFLPGGNLVQPFVDYAAKEASSSGNQGGTPIFGVVGGVLRNLLDGLWNWAKSLVTQTLAPGGGAYANYQGAQAARAAAAAASVASDPLILGATKLATVQAIQLVASTYGWGSGPEWNALVSLVNSESGFNNTAQNPTSTAFGAFQFLNGTWAGMPYGKTSDPYKQAVDGMLYIARRYGDPIHAWSYHLAHNSYDTGGWLPPGYSMSYNGTGRPEAILNARQSDMLASVLSGASGGAVPTTIAGIANSNIYVTDLAELARVQRQAARRTMAGQGVTV